MTEDIVLTPLSIIKTANGSVLHAMKKNDQGFEGYGEAYFSEIESQGIKAWKRHKEMTLNLIVPMGAIRFVLYDNRVNEDGNVQQVVLSKNNYQRLTIPPMVWVGFQGVSNGTSMLLNIANITHSPDEVNVKDINEINFNWEK
jgi:dTDP-4-dehydrorhamnose 3,5-epimerase